MFNSIRSKIVIFTSLLLSFAVVLCLVSTLWVFNRSQQEVIEDSFSRTEGALSSIISAQRMSLQKHAQLIGVLPILRATVDAGDVPTIRDTASGYQEDLKLPIFDIYGGKGELLTSLSKVPGEGKDPALIDRALNGGTGDSLLTRNGIVTLVAAAPIGQGGQWVGALVLGIPFDDEFAAEIKKLTGTDISFLVEGKITGSSLEKTEREALTDQLTRQSGASSDKPTLWGFGDYLLKTSALADDEGKKVGQMVVQSSLKAAEAVRRKVLTTVIFVGAFVLALALLSGAKVAGSLSAPISALKDHIEKVIKTNDLSKPIVVVGRDETAVLASSFNQMTSELDTSRKALEDYAKNLEKKVAERTAELNSANQRISAMLNNMPLSIFMVAPDGKVSSPVSKYSETIFGQSIEGKTTWDTLYVSLEKSSEEYGKLKNAMTAAYGESELQWSLSVDDFPTRVLYRGAAGERILKLKYSPLWDEAANLANLLFIVEDVTDLERLEKEAREAKAASAENIQILQELSDQDPQVIQDFLESSSKMVRRCSELAFKPVITPEDCTQIFRDLHTIKGNARIFRFAGVSSVVHQVEEEMVDLRARLGAGKQAPEDNIRIQVGLDRVRTSLMRYSRIATRIFKTPDHVGKETADYLQRLIGDLGDAIKKDPGAAQRLAGLLNSPLCSQGDGELEHQLALLQQKLKAGAPDAAAFFAEARKKLEASPVVRGTLGGPAAAEPLKTVPVLEENILALNQLLPKENAALSEKIRRLAHMPFAMIVPSVSSMVSEIAKTLGKNVEFAVQGQHVQFDRPKLFRVQDVLVHALRNSIDHGIETPAERSLAGKSATGSIRLDFATSPQGQISICLRDDGKGIDVKGLEEKVLERGMLTQEQLAAMSTQQKVELIFLPFVSTAKQVTQLSGRGIGMDVIKSVISEIGGKVEVKSELGKGFEIQMSFPS